MLLNFILGIDFYISNFVQTIWNSNLIIFFKFITYLGNPFPIIIISMLILLYLYENKNYKKFIFFLSIITIGEVLLQLLKVIFHRLRPQEQLINMQSYSLPSGHATMTTIISLGLFFIFKDKFDSKLKYNLFITFLILYPFLVGISRIYLNVHWFSDVIFGWILGFLIVFIIHKIFKNI